MKDTNIVFSKEQLEYLNSKYHNILSSEVRPNSSTNEIMYNAGVKVVLKDIAERTDKFRGTPPRG